MDLQLLYHNTFITVEEPNRSEFPARRSKSLPELPRNSPRVEAQVREKELADYVARLAGNVANIYGQSNKIQHTEQEETADIAKADASTDSTADLPSRGSMGHPDICRRPCVYFRSGSCEHGSSCGFCHMEHDMRLPKLDKKQRELIRSFKKTEVLSLMLRYLRLVSAQQGFELQASEILELVEHEVLAECQDPEAPLAIPEKMFKRLHKTLIRMHFAGIVGLASKEQIGSLREDLADALERLRIVAPQSRIQPQE
eukprot:Skav230412  [mRNA]  locus=scaffold4006:92416:93183:+ [translate_table: standard]